LIYLAATVGDVTTAGGNVTGVISDLWKLLVFQNNVMFQTIITPFKLIAAGIFLYQITPLLSMESHHRQQALKSIIGMIFVLLLFLNNGDGMRKFGILNYAFARGTADAIDLGFDTVTNTAKINRDIEGSEDAIREINAAVANCTALSPTIDGAPNPAYTQCVAKAKALVQEKLSSGAINDTSAGGLWSAAINAGDPLTALTKTVQAGSKLLDDATMAVPKAILDGLKSANSTIGEFAMLLSVLSSPLPLCLSLANIKPLIGWVSTFWGGAIFTICYSILSGIYNYLNASVPQSTNLLFIDIAIAVISPMLAGVIAAGGGMSVYLAFQQAGTAVTEAAATAAKV
jgi:hypothetical protein